MTPPIDDLDAFTCSYINTALEISHDDNDKYLSTSHDIRGIHQDTLAKMVKDCSAFQEANWDDIASDPDLAGYHFWLTRNGHGSGFWNGDWGEVVGERLTDASHKFGEFNLYVGDDGKVHGYKG